MQRRPLSSSEVWLAAVCVGVGALIVPTVEQMLTVPDYAAFARRLGIPVPIPSQQLGYLGGFNLGLVLAIVIGGWLGFGVSRLIWHVVRWYMQRAD